MTEELFELEQETKNINKPMTKWARVIVETDEEYPQTVALITDDASEVDTGFRIRLKAVENTEIEQDYYVVKLWSDDDAKNDLGYLALSYGVDARVAFCSDIKDAMEFKSVEFAKEYIEQFEPGLAYDVMRVVIATEKVAEGSI
ncbi:hypothetical protein IR127_03485 [Lactobacillus murinus]|uniref:hypothetical protein n=1 Tax=Ligilactobacillus murinus TaxID=1622 RepID=UPI00188347FC|nr:hypothetical protein [Ligilactobacillus murinus]MBF0831878.1 hypothetical protein [Ligilactobacillus murinus]